VLPSVRGGFTLFSFPFLSFPLLFTTENTPTTTSRSEGETRATGEMLGFGARHLDRTRGCCAISRIPEQQGAWSEASKYVGPEYETGHYERENLRVKVPAAPKRWVRNSNGGLGIISRRRETNH
jgi:hypothetical protein